MTDPNAEALALCNEVAELEATTPGSPSGRTRDARLIARYRTAAPALAEHVRRLVACLEHETEATEQACRRYGETHTQLCQEQVAHDATTMALAATQRELERWRHGVTIEGDFVCPDSLRMTKAIAERDRLAAALADADRDLYSAACADARECAHDRDAAIARAAKAESIAIENARQWGLMEEERDRLAAALAESQQTNDMFAEQNLVMNDSCVCYERELLDLGRDLDEVVDRQGKKAQLELVAIGSVKVDAPYIVSVLARLRAALAESEAARARLVEEVKHAAMSWQTGTADLFVLTLGAIADRGGKAP